MTIAAVEIHITDEKFTEILGTKVIHGFIAESSLEWDYFGNGTLYLKIVGEPQLWEPFSRAANHAEVDVEIERQNSSV